MKKELIVKITYVGKVTFEAPKKTIDTFVSEILKDIGLYGGCSATKEGSYIHAPFERIVESCTVYN